MSDSFFTSFLLLAQDAAQPAAQPEPAGPSLLLPLLAIPILFYFLILRPQKSKDQALRSLVDNLKEKDRVVTIGGIHGVVTNVQRDQEIVTLRIDESTGTKIKVGVTAIARVVADDEEKKSE